MNQTFRQSMAALHSWVGLLPGWLLFVIFLFGTTAFFQSEIDGWMHPELRPAPLSARGLDRAEALLKARAANAGSWSLSLPSARSSQALKVSWLPVGGRRQDRTEVTLDPATGRELAVRDSAGGFFLYRMHFDLHYMPVMWARYLVSMAALAMLVAILSGVVTHKKIFTDFFLLRFGKGQRSWLDAHNVTAVLALPFHLMITYTGLVTLLFTLMPWAISANFRSMDAYYEAAFPPAPTLAVSGPALPLLPLSDLIARAERSWRGGKARYVAIEKPGEAGVVVGVWPGRDRLGARHDPVYLNGATGATVSVPTRSGGAAATQRVMIDLHTGSFSGTALRWLYFLSGVAGTVMVATGLVLWTVKRRARLPDPARPHFGFRLTERLNIGVIVGAPAGIAVYFLANRLLPVGMPHRADWEINSLFVAWGGLVVWTIARPTKRAWIEALTVCAALYLLVPIVGAVATARGFIVSLVDRDWVFVGFDLTMVATATAFLLAAWRVARHRPKSTSRRRVSRQEAGGAA